MLLFEFLKVFHLLGLKELIDAAQVFAHSAMPELIHFAYQSVEEVTVVANHDERAVEVQERLFEHIFGLEVEMVGRLVKDEQVSWLQE